MVISEKLKEQFIEVLAYSQNIERDEINKECIDSIFFNWAENKDRIYNAFGKQLIWESDEVISFTLSEEEKLKLAENFIKLTSATLDVQEFLTLNLKGIINNTVVESCCYIDRDTNEVKTIPKGMKLSKALKYYCKGETLKFYQNELSSLIQKDKIKGKVCLSIHPLDYLSASENNANWSSCHKLHGDYAAGNVSYMQDNCTVIAYIKSEEPQQLNNFPEGLLWNNKKWRAYIYIEPTSGEFAVNGRQYPFPSDNIMNYIAKIFSELNIIEQAKKWEHHGFNELFDCSLRKNYFVDRYFGEIVLVEEVVKNAPESCHYNDALSSSVALPIILRAKMKYGNYSLKGKAFSIGAPVNCICCNNKNNDYKSDNSFFCEDCYKTIKDLGYCTSCGCTWGSEELMEVANTNELICPDCRDFYIGTTYQICDWCNGLINIEDTEDFIEVENPEDEKSINYYCCEECKVRNLNWWRTRGGYSNG